MIKEFPDGRMRCSMRSNGEIFSNDICRIHGGGGHFDAACCEFNISMAEERGMKQSYREYFENKDG
jgi:nanoRNase/pAp phosphatase (c-di-AMP/oligoRNAs hydrolase)